MHTVLFATGVLVPSGGSEGVVERDPTPGVEQLSVGGWNPHIVVFQDESAIDEGAFMHYPAKAVDRDAPLRVQALKVLYEVVNASILSGSQTCDMTRVWFHGEVRAVFRGHESHCLDLMLVASWMRFERTVRPFSRLDNWCDCFLSSAGRLTRLPWDELGFVLKICVSLAFRETLRRARSEPDKLLMVQSL